MPDVGEGGARLPVLDPVIQTVRLCSAVAFALAAAGVLPPAECCQAQIGHLLCPVWEPVPESTA